MFTIKQSLGTLALTLTVTMTGAIAATPASAASTTATVSEGVNAAAASSSSPVTTEIRGSQFCGVGVSYDACYGIRADYVRHGYRVGPIFWASTLGGYAFDYWK
jgi:hypothetical protein